MSARKETFGMRLACDGCHLRKLKCSRSSTACDRCLRDGVQCVYSPARKVGRPSKADQTASRMRGPNSDANAVEIMKSLRREQNEYSTSPQEQDSSHTAFWAQLSNDGYSHLPIEGFWNDPQPDAPEPNCGGGVTQYDNMTLTIGSESFTNDNVNMNQSLNLTTSFDELARNVGPKAAPNSSRAAIDGMALITPPREHSDSNSESSTTAVNSKVQRLSALQQELFRQRSHLPDAGGDDGPHEVVDVDAILGTSQAIIELTRGLFTTFAAVLPRAEQDVLRRVDWEYDPATMLLALTPSLLVVTTYDDVLALINAALDELSVPKVSQDTQTPWLHSFSDSNVEQTNLRTSAQSSKNAALLRTTGRIGILKLDIPLRLIISMSIMEYQLGPLERSLQLVLNHFQSQILDMSRGVLATSIDGLRSAIEGLLHKARKLIQRAKTLDLG